MLLAAMSLAYVEDFCLLIIPAFGWFGSEQEAALTLGNGPSSVS